MARVALVLCVAIAAIATAAIASPAQASSADETSVQAHVPSGDAAHFAAMSSSGPASAGSTEETPDPVTDPDQDTLGLEREAPEAVPALSGMGLEAPHSSRLEHRVAKAEALITRAIRPDVQPPRG